jgi:hypothetical protein
LIVKAGGTYSYHWALRGKGDKDWNRAVVTTTSKIWVSLQRRILIIFREGLGNEGKETDHFSFCLGVLAINYFVFKGN